jgi:hypothetical protein
MKKEELVSKAKLVNDKEKNEVLVLLNKCTTEKELKDSWQINQYITTKSEKYKKGSFDFKKEFLTNVILKKFDKKLDSEIVKIGRIYNSFDVQSAVINVEWTKSRMWGNNPRASVEVYGVDGEYTNTEGRSVGGCGYDKESTAIAEVLNDLLPIQKLFCLGAEKVNAYGFNNRYLYPYLNDGVGVNCYYKVFDQLGYKFESVSSGKTFDVYKITKI